METKQIEEEYFETGLEEVEEEPVKKSTKTVAIKINESDWNEFKLKCVEQGQSAGERLAELVLDDLEGDKMKEQPKKKFKIHYSGNFKWESEKKPSLQEIKQYIIDNKLNLDIAVDYVEEQ